MIAETNIAYQKEKAVDPKKDGLVAIWLRYSNAKQNFFDDLFEFYGQMRFTSGMRRGVAFVGGW